MTNPRYSARDGQGVSPGEFGFSCNLHMLDGLDLHGEAMERTNV